MKALVDLSITSPSQKSTKKVAISIKNNNNNRQSFVINNKKHRFRNHSVWT